uniref:tRNA pseudouridine synthase n=1 Tax=Scylla olivacea TaxID=85551 RepID=A0A0P4VX88_SCYOL
MSSKHQSDASTILFCVWCILPFHLPGIQVVVFLIFSSLLFNFLSIHCCSLLSSHRVHKTILVPSTFHARYDAVSRRYLYRLAVTPEPTSGGRAALEKFMPVAEIGKLYLVRPPFDAERLEPVCRLLEGIHDFASFANVQRKDDTPRETLREIKSVTVTPGRPLLDPSQDPLYSHLQFWDVNVHGKSFLYRQVRRTVGVLVGVAQGRFNLQDVQHMLDHPSQRNWSPKLQVAPPDGLFLLDVEYPLHVFAEEGEDSGQPPQE